MLIIFPIIYLALMLIEFNFKIETAIVLSITMVLLNMRYRRTHLQAYKGYNVRHYVTGNSIKQSKHEWLLNLGIIILYSVLAFLVFQLGLHRTEEAGTMGIIFGIATTLCMIGDLKTDSIKICEEGIIPAQSIQLVPYNRLTVVATNKPKIELADKSDNSNYTIYVDSSIDISFDELMVYISNKV